MRKTTLVLTLALQALTIGLASSAGAQTASQQGIRVTFNIEAQSLEDALNQFAQQTGYQVFFQSAVVREQTAPRIDAMLTPEIALKTLLANTNLRYKFVNPRTVTISGAGPSDTSFNRHSAACEDGIKSDECKSAELGNESNGKLRLAQSDTNSSEAASSIEQTQKLEEVVVSVFGRGVEESAREIPQSIDVFQRDFIDTVNARILDDVMRFVPNVAPDAGSFGPDPLYSYIFVRGFLASTTWNGLGYRSAGAAPPNMANVERIEVLKGPASVLYGSMEPGAVMNIVTKRPTSEFAAASSLRFGSYNDTTLTADVGGPISDAVGFRVNALYTRTDTVLSHNEIRDVFVAPVVEFALGEQTQLVLDASYEKRSSPKGHAFGIVPRSAVAGQGMPNPFGLLPISANLNYDESISGPDGYTHPQRWRENLNTSARLSHRFGGPLNLDMNLSWTYNQMDRKEVMIFTLPLASDNRTLPRGVGILEGKPYKENLGHIDFSGEFSTGAVLHKVTLGVDYMTRKEPYTKYYYNFGVAPIDMYEPVYGAIELPAEIPFNWGDSHQTDKGYFIQDRLSAGKWHLLVGGRLSDHHSEYTDTFAGTTFSDGLDDEIWTPQMGVLYDVTDKVSLFASRVESFVPRSAYSQSRGRTLVVPETSTQYEIGAKAILGDTGITANASIFRIEKEDILQVDPADPFDVIPIGGLLSEGFELSLSGRPSPALTVHAAFGYNKTEITEAAQFEGHEFALVPKYTLALVGEYAVQGGALRGLGITGSLNYTDDVWTFPYDVETPAWTRLNLGLSYPVSDRVDVAFNVNNVLNQSLHLLNAQNVQYRQERTYFGQVAVRF